MAKRKQPSTRRQAKHKKNRSPSQFDKRERLNQRNPRRKKTKRAKVPLVGPMLAHVMSMANMLDSRMAFRVGVIMAGMMLADDRRVAAAWFASGGVRDDWDRFYDCLIQVGHKAHLLPDANWRVLFVLMRYQGMRRQESLELKWSEVDWGANRFRFNSTKTGYRECPIFPETLPYLLEAAELRSDKQESVVRWHSDEHSVTPLLIKHAERILKKAWPKICTNLRSTRRTELDDFFPSHVVDEWIGHSDRVAREHYKQVTEDHWAKAATQVSTGVSITAPQESITGDHTAIDNAENAQKSRETNDFVGLLENDQHPRQDSNLRPMD